MKKSFEEVIIDEMRLFLELPITEERIQIFSNIKYEKEKEIRRYEVMEHLILVLPPSLMASTIKMIKEELLNAENILEALKTKLALKNHGAIEETCYLFLKDNDFTSTAIKSKYNIRRLTTKNKKAYETFRSACSQKDLEEGLVSMDDPYILGCFNENELIGCASYWFLTGHLADIGVVVHPDYRKDGVGKALVARLAEWGIHHGKLNMYRHDVRNSSSRQLALALGFKEYVNLETIKEKK